MYCHLCHVEASPTHDSSSGHHAARQLVAAAVDRLSNYVASEDSTEETPIVAESVKTPEALGFCDSCNLVVPETEHSSHLRMRNHALALLSEQMFEELVHAYVGEDSKLEPSDPTVRVRDAFYVDEAECIAYTCHLCDLEVPQLFKREHERGSRHRTSRILTLAAARRARNTISARSDRSDNGHKFTGKMMKKLLKAYRGYDDGDKSDIKESKEAEPASTKPESKRLTAKQYFTDVLSYLPYVGSFYSLIIDETEFVTVKISNETLKIHVNNFNGLHNFEGNGGNYINCRLCDGFNNACYESVGHQDKLHVMSLGHIKNVLSPVDSVHLIRKIDDTHSICGLCNMHIASHLVDNHILKDTRHTMALSEALDRGKQYKENKDNLKIMIFMPQSKKQSIFNKPNEFNNNNNKWTQPRHFSGTLFGSSQNTGLFGAHNTGHFSGQNTGFGNPQATGFGSAQNTGFRSTQATGFGSAQNIGFGSTQATGFGSAQNTGLGSAQNTGFGSAQNTGFGSAQNTGFGSTQATGFVSAQNTGFGSAQGFGAAKGSIFGAAHTQGHVTQQNMPAFGAAQNTDLCAQNQGQSGWNNSASTNQNTTFGGARNSTGSFGSPRNGATGIGAQNKKELFENTQNNTATFGAAQPAHGNAPVTGEESQTRTIFGSAQNTGGLFGNAQLKDNFGVSPLKKANSVPDEMNKAQKCTPTIDWNNSKSVNFKVKVNRPVRIKKRKPIGLDSTASVSLQTSCCSQNTFGNSLYSSSESEQDEKLGDTQTQSKNEDYAQINKSISISTLQPMKSNFCSSSSSEFTLN